MGERKEFTLRWSRVRSEKKDDNKTTEIRRNIFFFSVSHFLFCRTLIVNLHVHDISGAERRCVVWIKNDGKVLFISGEEEKKAAEDSSSTGFRSVREILLKVLSFQASVRDEEIWQKADDYIRYRSESERGDIRANLCYAIVNTDRLFRVM